MLEFDVIQVRGFHNLVEDDKITGFQFCIRTTYYRGIWLSMLRPGDVTVDGEVFPRDDVIWEINGVQYTPAQMLEESDVQWANTDVATIKIKKQGGLATGYHDVSVVYRPVMSYIPPQVDSDEIYEKNPPKPYTKRMILV